LGREVTQKIETESGTTIDEISNISAPNINNKTANYNNSKQHIIKLLTNK
jgi:hypothetical protein